jgi:hypothetical protein
MCKAHLSKYQQQPVTMICVKAAPPPTQSQELPVAEIRAFMDETRNFMNEMRAWMRNIDSRVTSLERASMN